MRRSIMRSTALMLALCGLVLRAALPTGWMPNPSGLAGGIPLVVCTLDGLHRIVPTPAHRPDHTPAHHETSPCPFAAAAHLSPPQAPAALAPTAVSTSDAVRPVYAFAAPRTRPGRLNGPRAPPQPA